MATCFTIRRHFLLALCIATMIAGQPASRLALDHTSPDAPQTVHHYDYMVSQVFCVPNGFTHHDHGLVTPDSDTSLRFMTPQTKRQTKLPPVCEFFPTRPLWYGPPPLRSPPVLA